jgi:hypothetical protein
MYVYKQTLRSTGVRGEEGEKKGGGVGREGGLQAQAWTHEQTSQLRI